MNVPVDAEHDHRRKKLTTTRRDEPERPERRPSGPPHSGWVQQDAAANAGWRLQFRFAVNPSRPRVAELEQDAAANAGWRLQFRFAVNPSRPRVAELGSLGHLRAR